MRSSLIFILLLNCMIAQSQSKISTVELRKGVVVTGVIEKFVKQKHKIDTCGDSFKNKYICKIDNNIWFGSDQGLELPQSQLLSLKIKVFNEYIPLNVSKMFNPTFGSNLSETQFKLKKLKGGYILYSFFSDGAGTYTVYWKIYNHTSKRILIS